MKKAYFILLFLFFDYTVSGQKVRFKLNASTNYPVIPGYSEKYPGANLSSVYTSFGVYQSVVEKEGSINTSFSSKPGAKAGGSFLINLSDKLTFETGVLASLIRFQRKVQVVHPVISYQFTGDKDTEEIYKIWGRELPKNVQGSRPAPDSEPDPQVGKTRITYIEVPQTFSYSLNRLIYLKAGFSTSILVSSEQYSFSPAPLSVSDYYYDPAAPAGAQGSYIKVKNGNGLSKALFALSTGVTLKATEHIGFEFDYARYLTPIYEAPDGLPKPKYNLFSCGSSYTF